jgi:hypothetical protein
MRFNQAVAAFACVLAVSSPRFAVEAAPHAGGHGGGFHGGFGGFHGGGLGGFHGAHFGDHHGGFWHGHRHGGWWWGGVLGLAALPHFYDPYFYDYDYPDYAAYDYVASQYWYYCPYPAGFYPYVQQCSTAWQLVPAV